MRGGIALADLGKLQAPAAAADDPHGCSRHFRSAAAVIASGAGDFPMSISRLPTM